MDSGHVPNVEERRKHVPPGRSSHPIGWKCGQVLRHLHVVRPVVSCHPIADGGSFFSDIVFTASNNALILDKINGFCPLSSLQETGTMYRMRQLLPRFRKLSTHCVNNFNMTKNVILNKGEPRGHARTILPL